MMSNLTTLTLLAGAALSNAALAAEPMSRDEVRSMVTEMLADADTRSSLLQGGGVAGYDKGFVVRSPDGAYSVKLNGLVQFRYVASFRNIDDTGAAGDDLTHSFQLRKSYLIFSGNLVNSDLRYNVRLIQTGSDAVTVDDVFADYNLGNGLSIRAGQFRPNFLKEQLNGEGHTLGVERGVVDSWFNQGRAQGVSLKYAPSDALDLYFDFTDGFRSRGSDLNGRAAEYAVTGRANWTIMGSKDDLRDYTSKVGSATSAQAGVALHYEEAQESAGTNVGGPAFPQDKFFAWTVDGQIEGGGFGAFAALTGVHRDGDNAIGSNYSAYGFTAQGSWRWDAAPEVFVKYDGVYVDSLELGTPRDNYHFVSLGFNNYYADNAAKFTIDALVAITGSDTTGFINASGIVPGGSNPFSTALGLNGSARTSEVAIRAQLQVMF